MALVSWWKTIILIASKKIVQICYHGWDSAEVVRYKGIKNQMRVTISITKTSILSEEHLCTNNKLEFIEILNVLQTVATNLSS